MRSSVLATSTVVVTAEDADWRRYSWWQRPQSRDDSPRVLVVGCGAVGSVVGFHLARGGAQIAFLVHEHRARELDGLRLERLGLCTCSKGSAAMTKLVEWVGFSVFTNVPDCCGPVRLRSDSPNQEAKPFDAVVMAVSAASARAAAPMLKQLVEGLGRRCAVVRVVSELGQDRFFHNVLCVHHTALIDLGIGFVSYPLPLEGGGRPGVGNAFAYCATSTMLLSSSSDENTTGHPMMTRLADCFNNSELSCRCVPSVGAALAMPSAALLGLVVNLEYAEWKLAAIRDDTGRQHLLCRSLGEALDIATSDNEGRRQRHAQRCCRYQARLVRAILTNRCILKLVLWFATCAHCSFLTSNIVFPFEVELFLRQHFSKSGVQEQTRMFLDAYIAAARERKLPVAALGTLAAALPTLPAARVPTRYWPFSSSRSRSSASSDRAEHAGPGKRKLWVGKVPAVAGPEADVSTGEEHCLHQVGSDLVLGCTVVLVGLKGATHHNGKSGTVHGVLDEKSRYVVKLSETGEKLAVKRENLSMTSLTQ